MILGVAVTDILTDTETVSDIYTETELRRLIVGVDETETEVEDESEL